MAWNNVPANGWPQIKELEKLDALAKQIDNMPTFTSNDRAFLEDLPAYPDTDGAKVLTATTYNGDTSLSYEDIPEELPADPQSDGTRVLTATTSSGETVKSWEAMQGNKDYSTSEQATGQKWIDGSPVYFRTYSDVQLTNSTDVVVDSNFGADKKIINLECIAHAATEQIPISSLCLSGSIFAYPYISNGALKVTVNGDFTSYKACITIYYIKTTT